MPEQSRPDRARCAQALGASTSISTWSRRWSRTRRSAMAASAASPPASWKAWRRVDIPAYRLRHPLRARPVPPGDRRRLAGRTAGGLAGARQSLGVRAARELPTRSASAARRDGQADDGRDALRLEAGRERDGDRPSTPRLSAGAASASTRCGCGRPSRSTRSCSTPSIAGDHIGALARKQARRKASPACSIRPMPPRPARNCACARNTSSPPRRCRTSCAATSAIRPTSVPARQGRDPAQ